MPSVVGVKGVNACDVGYVSSENAGPVGPLSTALNMVDKKVRNLEKRKCKLDGYRADSERGKELNNDQKSAIAKYDEVLHTLEFARELSAQFRSLCQEDDRIKKKAAKRENAERNRYEAGRVTQILKLQSLLKKTSSIADWEGMANLDGSLVKGIKAFIDLVNTSEQASSAEHYLALIDAKPGKKLGDVTYAQLKDAFTTLETALVSAATPLEQEQQQVQEEEEEPVAEETEEEVVESPLPPQEGASTPQVQEHPETLMPVNGADHALPPQQEFNFLQESQIDPINMDPAVVVVQHSPPQVFNPQGHMYPIPPQQVPFHQTTAAPYHPPQPTMSHSDPPAPLQPQNEAQELDNEAYHSNTNHTSKMSHSKNMEPESQEPNSAQPPPTIEDWSEENEVARENGGHYRGRGRGRGGYRAPRKDNGYRGGRGGRGGRSRGGGAGNMNGTGNHYRGEKEYRGRGGRGTRGGSYRGSMEKSNGNARD